MSEEKKSDIINVREKANEVFQEAKDNREVLELILSDLVLMSSEVQEEIKRVKRVPLLHNGISLEEILPGKIGDVLFLFGDEQVTARFKNVDTQTIPN